MSRLLSDTERRRFVEWLLLEATDANSMADQMEKMGGPAGPILARRERHYAVAATIIAERLSKTESVTVESGEEGI